MKFYKALLCINDKPSLVIVGVLHPQRLKYYTATNLKGVDDYLLLHEEISREDLENMCIPVLFPKSKTTISYLINTPELEEEIPLFRRQKPKTKKADE